MEVRRLKLCGKPQTSGKPIPDRVSSEAVISFHKEALSDLCDAPPSRPHAVFPLSHFPRSALPLSYCLQNFKKEKDCDFFTVLLIIFPA